MTPTAEQAAILSGFGNKLATSACEALAGTGKTSTLLNELVAQNPQVSFLYMVQCCCENRSRSQSSQV